MTVRVWRDGAQIRKRIEDENTARRLVSWTKELRAGNVQTPEGRLDAQGKTLIFQLIEGTAGLALIKDRGAPALRGLLRPLFALHRVAFGGLGSFDPAAKILPRLRPDDPAVLREDLQALLAELPDSPEVTSIHGDFHAGQLIMDSSGEAWLLDLEDLAVGDLESDLGNFAAHLATRPETRCGSILRGFEDWLGHTLEAYRSIGGIARTGRAHSHGRIALIRRALKLRVCGDPSILAELTKS